MNIKEYTLGMVDTNSYLVWSEESKEAIVIDPADDSPVLTNEIIENGLILKYIVLTHAHYDHFGGVDVLMKNFPDAKLISPGLDADLLIDSDLNHSEIGLGRKVSLVADIEVFDGDTIQIGDEFLKVIATPGHTKGGVSLLADDSLFTGDTIFGLTIGSTVHYGGDYQTIIDSITEKIFTLPPETRILPGHKGRTTVGYEKLYNPLKLSTK